MPILGSRDQIRTQWIALDAPQHREQVVVFLDRKRLESALREVQWLVPQYVFLIQNALQWAN